MGAALVVDGTQSVGAMPFDVARIQPDALIAATYKWLMGPYSMGFAYLGPRFDGGEPLEETWIGRAGSENFKELVHYRDDYQPGAIRYDVGERTNFALMPMTIAALEQVLDWQPERDPGATAASLTAPLFERVRALGYTVEDPALPRRAPLRPAGPGRHRHHGDRRSGCARARSTCRCAAAPSACRRTSTTTRRDVDALMVALE